MLFLINNMDVKDVPGITYYRTNDFKLEFVTAPKTSWCIDGEEYKTIRPYFEFHIDKSTKMLMPKENIKKLFKEEK